MSRWPALKDRFLGHVDRRDPDECWPWLGVRGSRNRLSYGYIKEGQRRRMAHRLAWEYTNGPIPDGMIVCHRCDNPPCCNPNHLFVGTYADNAHDRDRKGRLSHPRRLTDDQAAEIRERALAGEPHPELAIEFGISRTWVRMIARDTAYIDCRRTKDGVDRYYVVEPAQATLGLTA